MPQVLTLDHADQQYSLYLPLEYSPERQWPVLFVLDPRGRAMVAMELFRERAQELGWIVLSSYQSRSDTLVSVTTDAFQALLVDAQRRFSVDRRRFYLAGMSGTSHASWRFAKHLQDHVAGIIGCAGGLPHEEKGKRLGEVPFAYFGITATHDFNYQEQRELDALLEEAGARHWLEIFAGRHQWPDRHLTFEAMDWLELHAMKAGLTEPRRDFLEEEFRGLVQRAREAEDLSLELALHRRIVQDFSGLRNVAPFAERMAELEASTELREAERQARRLAKQEEKYLNWVFPAWHARVADPDQPPPTAARSLADLRVRALQEQAADATNVAEADSASRLLESVYTAVAFYLAKSFRDLGEFEREARVLEVAVAIFPERRGSRWRLAEAYAAGGLDARALAALEAAVALGRVDLERLATDPAWERLRGDADWERLLQAAAAANEATP